MVKDREDEVGQTENENKLQQVQDRFPNDDLQLTERDMPKAEVSWNKCVTWDKKLNRKDDNGLDQTGTTRFYFCVTFV